MAKGKAAKGSIGLMSENNRLKVNFPRQHFPGVSQVRKALQLSDTPSNRAKAVDISDKSRKSKPATFFSNIYTQLICA